MPLVHEVCIKSSHMKSRSKVLREKGEKWLVMTTLCSVYNDWHIEAQKTPKMSKSGILVSFYRW